MFREQRELAKTMLKAGAIQTLQVVAQRVPQLFIEPRGKRYATRVSITIPFDVNGRRINIPIANDKHMNRIKSLIDGRKEPSTQNWIKSVLRPEDVFFDIGANVGIFSLLALTVCPKTTIVAFEPEPATAAVLLDTIALNGLPIQLVVQALGARRDHGQFNYNATVAAGYAEHQFNGSVDSRGNTFTPAASIILPIAPLDELVSAQAVPRPTHMKIDVDSGDLDVLHGARNTLNSVRSVAVECIKSGSGKAIYEFMTAVGFAETSKFGEGNMSFFVR